MAKDVTISGATFQNVPGITAPLASGTGDALFLDADGYSPVGHTHDVNTLGISNKTGGAPKVLEPMFDFGRADHLMFLPAEQVIIEQSVDGGATWQSANVSDADKRKLFAGNRDARIYIPNVNGAHSKLSKLRITITAMRYDVPAGTPETGKYAYWNAQHVLSAERYCDLSHFYVWLSVAAESIKIEVTAELGSVPGNWRPIATMNRSSGWAGGNFIAAGGSLTRFGGSSITQTGNYWNYRMVFSTVSQDENDDAPFVSPSITERQFIASIKAQGSNMWTVPNQMAFADHLYKWDVNQNALFPEKVYAQNNKELATLDAIPTASVTKTGNVATIHLGSTTATVTDGANGAPGQNGQDGYTPVKGVDYFDGAPGQNGTNGQDGQDGYTPVKGVDYWTQADRASMVQDVLAAIPFYDGSVT